MWDEDPPASAFFADVPARDSLGSTFSPPKHKPPIPTAGGVDRGGGGSALDAARLERAQKERDRELEREKEFLEEESRLLKSLQARTRIYRDTPCACCECVLRVHNVGRAAVCCRLSLCVVRSAVVSAFADLLRGGFRCSRCLSTCACLFASSIREGERDRQIE